MSGILTICQNLIPNDKENRCELKEGDDVFCDWELPNGAHPLHCAASDGNIEVMRSQIASGADVNTTNKYGLTPLMFACLYLKEECVVELLRLGANVHMIDDEGNTALHHVTNTYYNDSEKMERIAKMLMKAEYDSTIRNNENKTFIDFLKSRGYEKSAIELEEWIKEATK